MSKEPMEARKGYCVTCQTTRAIVDLKQIERGGGPAIEGTCTVCGSQVFVLGAGTPVGTEGGERD
jgi:hypothetical protein